MSSSTVQGFSRERLARIDRFFDEKYVQTGNLPGAQVQVLLKGELV